ASEPPPAQAEQAAPDAPAGYDEAKRAKYVFFFIGDGMSVNLVEAARYLTASGAIERGGAGAFTGFAYTGLITTHNAMGHVTDSAASATAMLSGAKTYNENINYNEETGERYKTMAERLFEAGFDVGVLTSVPLNHATPAAMYASTDDRYDYDEIAMQGIDCGYIDFWGGGGFRGDSEALLASAGAAGFEIYEGDEAIAGIAAGEAPVIATAPASAGDPYMAFELDRIHDGGEALPDTPLAGILEAAVTRLGDSERFFILTEAGKIDTACSQRDAAAAVYDVLALEDAVGVAIEFMKAHPDETLIVVTADHETGGVLLTRAHKTAYLSRQRMSYALFSNRMRALYDENAGYEAAREAAKEIFGIGADELDGEYAEALEDAYYDALEGGETGEGLDPFVRKLCDIMSRESGVAVTTASHTAGMVPVFASGCGAELFTGCYDNVEIFSRLLSAMGLPE
ncbi:MAG: alkaline phosphatase, partial [Clostridia bacterium]|nr:alkaline phosphatase [Clostridia bacterium]